MLCQDAMVELRLIEKRRNGMLKKSDWIRKVVLVGCAAIFFAGVGKLVTRAANTPTQPTEVKIDNFTFAPQRLRWRLVQQ